MGEMLLNKNPHIAGILLPKIRADAEGIFQEHQNCRAEQGVAERQPVKIAGLQEKVNAEIAADKTGNQKNWIGKMGNREKQGRSQSRFILVIK